MLVLIIEDEKELGEVFCDFVRGLGHRAVFAPNAEVETCIRCQEAIERDARRRALRVA